MEQNPFSPESVAATAALFTSPYTTAAFDASVLHDPLKINLKNKVRELLILLSSSLLDVELETRLSGTMHLLRSFLDNTSVGVGNVLDALSICLGVPQLAEDVVRLFRPLLIDLFARWLAHSVEGEEVREERLAVLAYFVEVYEEIYP
jgi:midasin